MKEVIPVKVWGAWFFESGGITLHKGEAAPPKGWRLIEVVSGKFKEVEEIKPKIDAVLELHPRCDILLIGRGDHFDTYDMREYKSHLGRHIR